MTLDRETPALILDAAERLFARHGFAATSTKQIAAESGRNAALISYHFGGKENLYKQVLRRLVERVVAIVGGRLASVTDPGDAVRAIAHAQVQLLSSNANMHRLMVREMADWGAAHAEDAIHHLGATLFRRVCELIRAGQHSGAFRHDLDPRLVAISLISQMNWILFARPAIGILLGRGLDGLTPADLERLATHVGDFTLSALRPVADGTSSSGVASPTTARREQSASRGTSGRPPAAASKGDTKRKKERSSRAKPSRAAMPNVEARALSSTRRSRTS